MAGGHRSCDHSSGWRADIQVSEWLGEPGVTPLLSKQAQKPTGFTAWGLLGLLWTQENGIIHHIYSEGMIALAENKKQHYVPKLYMKNFTQDGQSIGMISRQFVSDQRY